MVVVGRCIRWDYISHEFHFVVSRVLVGLHHTDVVSQRDLYRVLLLHDRVLFSGTIVHTDHTFDRGSRPWMRKKMIKYRFQMSPRNDWIYCLFQFLTTQTTTRMTTMTTMITTGISIPGSKVAIVYFVLKLVEDEDFVLVSTFLKLKIMIHIWELIFVPFQIQSLRSLKLHAFT